MAVQKVVRTQVIMLPRATLDGAGHRDLAMGVLPLLVAGAALLDGAAAEWTSKGWQRDGNWSDEKLALDWMATVATSNCRSH